MDCIPAARAEDSAGHRRGEAGPLRASLGAERARRQWGECEHACVGEDPGVEWTWSRALSGPGGRERAGAVRTDAQRPWACALGERNLSPPLSLPTGGWVKLAATLTVVTSGEGLRSRRKAWPGYMGAEGRGVGRIKPSLRAGLSSRDQRGVSTHWPPALLGLHTGQGGQAGSATRGQGSGMKSACPGDCHGGVHGGHSPCPPRSPQPHRHPSRAAPTLTCSPLPSVLGLQPCRLPGRPLDQSEGWSGAMESRYHFTHHVAWDTVG